MKKLLTKYVSLMVCSFLLLLPIRLRADIVWFMANIKHKLFGSAVFNEYKEKK